MKLMKRYMKLIPFILIACILASCNVNDKKPENVIGTAEPGPTPEPIVDVMVGETLDAEYASEFSVSNVFSKDMVVQRGEHLRVWGTAPESENGKKVSGEFKGMFAEALIENGQWTLTFGARLEASTEMGHSMRIYTDTQEEIFEDVLVGDVYMVIGQSNVAYTMVSHWEKNDTEDKGGRGAIDRNAPIRIHYNSLSQYSGYDFPMRGTDEVCPELCNKSRWRKATTSTIGNFSAIGYLFAYNMIDITNETIPVGIIEIDGNGQPLGAFMANSVAEKCGTDEYDELLGYYKTTGVNADAGRYMYNHYMYPFEKYAIAGIVWYQGESDFQQKNASVFAQNFSELMKYMRSTHNLINKNFPVYVVEFPPNYNQPANFKPSASAPQWSAMNVGLIRSVLGSIPQYLLNSYISVSSDLWLDDTYWNTLHPYCKFEQAKRTAELAAGVLNIIPMEEATGPIFSSVEFSKDGKKAVLTYSNVGAGLATSDGGDVVKGFGQLNSDYSYTGTLEAKITSSNQITVTSSTKIEGIGYNYIMDNVYGEDVNLCNSFGNPASAMLVLSK